MCYETIETYLQVIIAVKRSEVINSTIYRSYFFHELRSVELESLERSETTTPPYQNTKKKLFLMW